ncbi:MAG: AraC family transcriptional regulator [Clostridia bacterium]|nr:AraC family transcriptional regulator [Clostridia bacterium]
MGDCYIRNVFELPFPWYLMNIMQREAGFYLKPHCHDRYHINLITDGSVDVITSSGKVTVGRGVVFIVPPNVEHSLFSKTGYSQKGADICVSDGYGADKVLQELCEGNMVRIMAKRPELADAITAENLENPSPYAAIKCTNSMMSLIIDLAESKRKGIGSFGEKFVSVVHKYENGCSLEQLCTEFFCSKTQLERLVQKEFGCSAVEYVNRIRFKNICNMLVSTDEPLYIIAERYGFYDSAHMSVFFKKRSGISPMRFRREFR